MINFSEIFNKLHATSNLTKTEVACKLAERRGLKPTKLQALQNFSHKLQRNTIRFNEAMMVVSILGYKIKAIKKEVRHETKK